jgi:biotin/methionine sulfoxide reductase
LRGDYSYGTSDTLLPHVVGSSVYNVMADATTWEIIREHTQLFISFADSRKELRSQSW